ncbi:MAG TPA: SDR family NAD(P)-dependent oxidoreductase [Rhodanobacteraceae bacterium]|jgi:NAD(P)-dependent dehydrogenase (short-subunit alcohol dehydrogenase family)|nr:SDR family NAD(P)-dependent oxidoreductase [Rhodanobacteraceae bacterium]
MTLPMARLPVDWTPAAESLAGRVVLITGAAGGLGRASALACARAGATVLLADRKTRALEPVYDEIAALPGRPQPVLQPMDLQGASPLEYQTFAESIERQLGRLDGLVHAAVKCEGLTPLAMLSPDEWITTLHVDLSAPFLLTQACMPLLLAREDSAVVFVLDDPERMGRAHWGAYGVAKAGLEGLASILHEETEDTSLRVHALLPAPMRTALRSTVWAGEDSSRVATPEAAAQAVLYLLSPDALATRGKLLDLREPVSRKG